MDIILESSGSKMHIIFGWWVRNPWFTNLREIQSTRTPSGLATTRLPAVCSPTSGDRLPSTVYRLPSTVYYYVIHVFTANSSPGVKVHGVIKAAHYFVEIRVRSND
jgi:hypothetical protein